MIPWRSHESRIDALTAVTAWYFENFVEFKIHLVDSTDDVFNLAQARNSGVALVADPTEVVIVNDADTIPDATALRIAISVARTSGVTHLPYTSYRWLGPSGTRQLQAGLHPEQCDHHLVPGACSGVYVTTPRSWASHGGQDERFRGWGFEDAAWYLAHTTLLGEPPRRNRGVVFALSHDLELRSGPQYESNAALMKRYREASSDPAAMFELVAESAESARLLPGV